MFKWQKINKDKIILMYAKIVLLFILFRNTIRTLFGGDISLLGIVGLLSLFPIFFLLFSTKKEAKKYFIFVFLFYYLSILTVLQFPKMGITSIVGFCNIFAPMFFFLTLYRLSTDKEMIFYNIIKFIILITIINSIGAIIQGSISENIFGLISNDIYANKEFMERGTVTPRFISFISSPQSLALFLAFGLALVAYFWPENYPKKYKIISLLLIFISGSLTLSKAFFLFILIIFIGNTLINRNLLTPVFLFSLLLLGFISFNEKFERIYTASSFIFNISSYSAFKHWIIGFQDMDKLGNLLLGKGVGFYSRGGQILSGSNDIHGVESYFIQIFAEIGLIGFLSILFIIINSVRNYLTINKLFIPIIVAFVVNGFFSPALYGYLSGTIFSFIIISSYFIKRINLENHNI